jgi:hypothetical protein
MWETNTSEASFHARLNVAALVDFDKTQCSEDGRNRLFSAAYRKPAGADEGFPSFLPGLLQIVINSVTRMQVSG